MNKVDYPAPFQELVRQLKKLPGIGPRSAERIALWMIQSVHAKPDELAEAVLDAKKRMHKCPLCGFFSEAELCQICRNEDRAHHEICVVEQATDVIPIERTGMIRGRYHALGGRLAPLDNVGPEDLRIAELMDRIKTENPTEIILALGSDVESEATASYLAGMLKTAGLPVTRIAQGIPAGVGLEHSDELTLSRALSGRIRLSGN
ncbi:MAG: recombination mediator RecR [Chthoniobacterales bacterium]